MKLIYLFFLFPFCAFSNLQTIVQKYAKSSGVIMEFKKNTYLDLLQKTKNSKGKIFIQKNLFLLQMEDILKTKIFCDGKTLSYTTAHSKKAITVTLNKEIKNKTILFILFQPQKLFQQFKIKRVYFKGRAKVEVLKPLDINSDIDFFSVKTEREKVLKINLQWKNPKNKEEYTFFNIQFNKKILPEVFNIKN